VLPFANLSPDERYAYLSAGLTEEILVALTQYAELPVMGPLSRERLEREGLGPRSIGARYGARFVLDGSVAYYAGRIRVRDRGLVDGQPAAHVCRAFACQAPVTKLEGLRAQLESQ